MNQSANPVVETTQQNFQLVLSLGDFIEDKSAENPVAMTATRLLKEKLDHVLGTLNERRTHGH